LVVLVLVLVYTQVNPAINLEVTPVLNLELNLEVHRDSWREPLVEATMTSPKVRRM
jgi:hypothetical protein